MFMHQFVADYHFIKRQQKHKGAFGIHPIRAVLIETTDESRARKLMELAEHPVVIGQGKRSTLFWFCISPLLTAEAGTEPAPPMPRYLLERDLIMQPLWALPDLSLHSLNDVECFPAASHLTVSRAIRLRCRKKAGQDWYYGAFHGILNLLSLLGSFHGGSPPGWSICFGSPKK
jgi:hypothetical protein